MEQMRHVKWIAGIGVILGIAFGANARINVDTVPARDSVQLTIYNSVDLTMVRETRYLTLRKGLNHLEFSWANTLIDPTSVEFKALSHADEVEVLDVSFPPRVTNTLEWRISSEFSGEVKVEIRYFTSGISWAADYVTGARRDEKLASLAGFVKVNNRSGEEYENAQVRLVVGVIKLVEDIARLASGERMTNSKPLWGALPVKALRERRLDSNKLYFDASAAIDQAEAKAKDIVKENLSEYFLYTVEGRETVPDGWSKRLPSFGANDVPLTSYYKFEKETWGDRVERFYKFKNDTDSKLGNEPLPNGDVKVFRRVSDDDLLSFVGATTVKYVPLNETVEMDLGWDREVMVQPNLLDWKKDELRFNKDGNVDGWTLTENWKLELQNSKDIEITLDVRRNFAGDWTIKSVDGFEKVDANKVKFVTRLQPHEKKTLAYELVTRYGTNATR
jgi:hypothetical protein